LFLQALREWNNTSRTRFTCDVKNIKFILNKFLLVFCHHRIPSKSNGEERILRESDLIVIHDKYEKSLFAIVDDVKQKRLDPRQNGKWLTIVLVQANFNLFIKFIVYNELWVLKNLFLEPF
jgi:hypothetical protein